MDGPTRAVYEARAHEWAERRPARLSLEAAAFSRRCLPTGAVADLGCGPGTYLAELGSRAIGLDGARAMLDVARRAQRDIPLLQGDLSRLPFAPGRLAGAWARASYLHVRRHDLPAALAQLHRALAVDAPLEMTLRAGDGEGPLPDDDFPGRFFARWPASELVDVVGGAGFDPQELTETGEWLTVRATRSRTLPDFVGPGMAVLVCGLNPSVVAADAGYGFAGVTNRFWPAAVAAGLIGAERTRRPLLALAGDGVGMTDLVKRATPRASGVTADEYREGARRVERLVAWLRPGLALFVGLQGWRAAVDRHARPGRQPEPFGGVAAYVMPSTSGLNARTTLPELVAHLRTATG